MGDLVEFAGVMGILALFVVIVTGGIILALRVGRRGAGASAEEVDQLRARVAQLEQSVDVVAVEIERVGEAQRYTERLLAPAPGARADVR